MSIAGAIARRLSGWTSRIAPPDRREWAAAITRELDEIVDDRSALSWALGGFSTCLQERIESMRGLMIVCRLGLAGACALFAVGTALPAVMVMAYRSGWTAALEATQATVAEAHLVGEGGQRFSALLDSVRDWQLGLALLSVALCLAAGVLITLRHRLAPWTFVGVVVLSGVSMASFQNQALFREVFTPAELEWDFVGLVLKTIVAASMYWAVRPRGMERC